MSEPVESVLNVFRRAALDAVARDQKEHPVVLGPQAFQNLGIRGAHHGGYLGIAAFAVQIAAPAADHIGHRRVNQPPAGEQVLDLHRGAV